MKVKCFSKDLKSEETIHTAIWEKRNLGKGNSNGVCPVSLRIRQEIPVTGVDE